MTNTSSSNGRKRKFPQLFLGVDGGGTKTHAVLMNEKKAVVSEGVAGPSNPLRVGVETAVSNIIKAVDMATDSNGFSRGDIVAATLGLAGVRREDLRQRIRQSFVQRLRVKKTVVITDAEIAWYGTTLGKAGLVVIAGTGSICFGKDDDGIIAIAGGWGPVAGDEGGGIGIAEQALHSVAKASDGRGTKTSLSAKATEYFRASTPENLIVAIYSPQMDNMRIAGFARYVVEAALEGDNVAIQILKEAGFELGLAAYAVIKKLNLRRRKIPVGCVGSIFNAGVILTDPMIETIQTIAPKAFLTKPLMVPANAAAQIAMNSY
ncbi:MAG: BadF/BadG/BcrA/BcrD ATPase family protein [Pyrinomonadaceae bacterium]